MCHLIFLNALLDVLALLAPLKLLIFVVDNIGHAVHYSLYALTSLLSLPFSPLLLLLLSLDDLFDLFGIVFLSDFLILHLPQLFHLIVLDHLSCSLSFFSLPLSFLLLFIFDFSGQFLHTSFLFILPLVFLELLLLFGLFKHDISHAFLIEYFLLQFLLLLLLLLDLFSCCIEDSPIECFPLFNLFHLDNISPFIHWGAVVHTPELDSARAAGINTTLRDLCVVIHVIGAFTFIALLSVHISHVVRHQVYLKDQLLKRMLK